MRKDLPLPERSGTGNYGTTRRVSEGPSLTRRVSAAAAVLAGAAAVAALLVTRNYAADKGRADQGWTTKKIMNKVHFGKKSPFGVVYGDIQKAEPDWQTDEKNLAEIVRLMSMLTKRKPPRGSQEAWDKLVHDYVDGAKEMQQYVKEHKLQPARDSLDKVRATCDECHDNHGVK